MNEDPTKTTQIDNHAIDSAVVYVSDMNGNTQQPTLNTAQPTVDTPLTKRSSARISELVLFGTALAVIIAIITGIQSLGVIGLMVFFFYGLIMIAASATKGITKVYKTGNFIFAAIFSVLLIPFLLFIVPQIFVLVYILSLILGFAEQPEVNS